MENIDSDYNHVKRIWKDFEINNSGEHYGFYLKSGTLLLAEVFGNLYWEKYTETFMN